MSDPNQSRTILDIDGYILQKKRNDLLNIKSSLFNNLSQGSSEIVSGIQSRLREIENLKVRNYVIDNFLKKYLDIEYSGDVGEDLENLRTALEILLEDPFNQEFSKYYPGWNEKDFHDLHWILYGGKEREVKSIIFNDNVLEKSQKLSEHIQLRLKNCNNKKVIDHVHIILGHLATNPRITYKHINEIKSELESIIDGGMEELKKAYFGWKKKDIQELYKIYYAEKYGE